ncbi:hypothetical protein PCASD_01822 [Puccinia coronata f. sp. avenae]|uniref:Tc1-like transposase DDE domain-containing protein n=1 Tax=Puccinia coronata f. sp. avenae TaxID=200324 RepID=A0A2N5VJI0_9BASI|nr:hypothetical protein PCASD_01822 [Puccinia coronata f. sp. avenae]
MSRSKASQGQVNRWRRERKQKEVQGSNVKRRKSKPKSKSTAAKAGKSDFPILIESDTDNDIQIMPTPTYKQINKEDSPIIILDDDEIFDFHENEIDEIDQANDIMQYTQAASDDSSENDDSESEDESSNMLWPVFQNHNKSTDQIARCRVVKSGRSGYQRPIENPNLSSLKLVPRPLPRATKHDRKVQRLKALGSNNNTMANWLSQARNSSSTLPKESKETAEGPQPIDDDETPAEDTRDPVTLRLIGIQQAYLLKKPIEPSEPNAPDPLPAWKELNEAIQSATTRFKERCKKDPKLKFPTTIIQSLTEFNNLRYKYSVEKTKAPGLSASLATAQSAIRRLPSLSGPQKSRSGLYLARNIMKQVRNNECCWSKILSQQSDFVNERPLLQSIIEDAGHVCLFLPKFHCELNPIELYWSYIKQAYRKESHKCANFKESKVLFKRIRQSCPITTIRKYFRRIDRQLSAYRQGYNGPQSAILMKKYTSHRCIPRDAAMRINVLTS